MNTKLYLVTLSDETFYVKQMTQEEAKALEGERVLVHGASRTKGGRRALEEFVAKWRGVDRAISLRNYQD